MIGPAFLGSIGCVLCNVRMGKAESGANVCGSPRFPTSNHAAKLNLRRPISPNR
jgi:hypothetical protein